MTNLKAGDIAWIVESTTFVKGVEIINVKGGFATLRFKDSNGGMRVRESRLYKTKEEAEKVVDSNKWK